MEPTVVQGDRYKVTVHPGKLQGDELRAVLEDAAKTFWKEIQKQKKKGETTA